MARMRKPLVRAVRLLRRPLRSPRSSCTPVGARPTACRRARSSSTTARSSIDTHVDTPQRLLFDKTFDIAVRQTNGNIDVPRMREGGLDAVFFSIWVPSDVTGPPAVKRAMDQIDAVREAARRTRTI